MRSNCELHAKRMRFYATAYELHANGIRPHTNLIRIVCDSMLRKAKKRKANKTKIKTKKQNKNASKFLCVKF